MKKTKYLTGLIVGAAAGGAIGIDSLTLAHISDFQKSS